MPSPTRILYGVGPNVFEISEFAGYALLDSGQGEKLERFGELVLRRPDPQALWNRRGSESLWRSADLTFVRESDRGGRWEARRGAHAAARDAQPSWLMDYSQARFVIRPTPFKHVGVFPEQASNWEFVARAASQLGTGARLLNLFGYTGAASVLAHQAGLEVTHVDASKTSLGWMRENLVASGLPEDSLRVLLEDALVFAQREVRRGSHYEIVLLDPPHQGRGPRGERWRLEQGLAPLFEAARSLVAERGLLVLSTYAVGYSPLAFSNLLEDFEGGTQAVGELALRETEGTRRLLPAGFCARWWRGLDL
ncbi:MAG: RsmD family RNA methyltransferase [bacterium]